MHVIIITIFFWVIASIGYAQDLPAKPITQEHNEAAPPTTEIEQTEDFQVDEPVEDEAVPTENADEEAITKPKKASDAKDIVVTPPAEVSSEVFNSDNAPEKNYMDTAILQGLNKITARTSLLTLPIGKTIRFGNLEVVAKRCWKSSPEDTPDNKALLDIWEQKPGEERKQLFNGWMFASSPALSALEHPVYDVTVIECKQGDKKAK
jgi:hypothetical protein